VQQIVDSRTKLDHDKLDLAIKNQVVVSLHAIVLSNVEDNLHFVRAQI